MNNAFCPVNMYIEIIAVNYGNNYVPHTLNLTDLEKTFSSTNRHFSVKLLIANIFARSFNFNFKL